MFPQSSSPPNACYFFTCICLNICHYFSSCFARDIFSYLPDKYAILGAYRGSKLRLLLEGFCEDVLGEKKVLGVAAVGFRKDPDIVAVFKKSEKLDHLLFIRQCLIRF